MTKNVWGIKNYRPASGLGLNISEGRLDSGERYITVNSTVSGHRQFRVNFRKNINLSRMEKYFDILIIQSCIF